MTGSSNIARRANHVSVLIPRQGQPWPPVNLRSDGESEFIFPSAEMLVTEAELAKYLIQKWCELIREQICSAPLKAAKAGKNLAAVEIAKKADCILCYDPNLRFAFMAISRGCLERHHEHLGASWEDKFLQEFHRRVGRVKLEAVDTTGADDA
ncbi:putative fructokinase-7 [Nicotiana tabacum]|uniref:Fructokinase-7 n=1 Tax=Nicotiana tabacum TaxID=4097 RepID=A0AC58TDQ0_TOBAC